MILEERRAPLKRLRDCAIIFVFVIGCILVVLEICLNIYLRYR